MKELFQLKGSRLFSKRENFKQKPFFSLVDYRNNYFISEEPDKILEFYNGFENRYQLVKWMRERPNGVANIYEIEGNKSIVVVIPTGDINGKYSKICKENTFKGLHIVFVESGNIPDPYFKYAHNCNIGIKKAMEYHPKWIILSNDDIQSNQLPWDLAQELANLDSTIINAVFTRKGSQTANKVYITKFKSLGIIVSRLLNYEHLSKALKGNNEAILINNLQNKFNKGPKNRYILSGVTSKLYNLFFFKTLYSFYNFESFGIFSSKSIDSKKGIFDETYINAHEDLDFSIKLSKEPDKIAWIDYNIRGIGAVSLGSGIERKLRTIASDCYFNLRIEEGLLYSETPSK